MDASFTCRGIEFCPARFCAPMAGLTHSAFRRLVADFGGCGGLFTEMLSGRWLMHENLKASPSVRRRPQEGRVIYQLMISEPADVACIVERLAAVHPEAVDLNCACPAPRIRSAGAGADLFEDRERLAAILDGLRRRYAGMLSVKIRLGAPREDWRERLEDRLRLFQNSGVDAVILHPRFSDEKLKRRARHELYPELAKVTRLPIVASGDIVGPRTVAEHSQAFAAVSGLMIGRMAVVRPWVFAEWQGGLSSAEIDHLEVWRRFAAYVTEDFTPGQAYYRIRAFTAYYARNFHFGHTLFAATQAAPDLETLRERAIRFLASKPQLVRIPNLLGLA